MLRSIIALIFKRQMSSDNSSLWSLKSVGKKHPLKELNIPEECWSQLHHFKSLKTQKARVKNAGL
jgi:hypothetical protein